MPLTGGNMTETRIPSALAFPHPEGQRGLGAVVFPKWMNENLLFYPQKVYFWPLMKAEWKRETFRHLLIRLILSDFGRVHTPSAIWFVFPKANLKRTVRREQKCMKCSSVISRTVKKQTPQFPLQSTCWSSSGRSGLGEHIGRLQGDGAHNLIIHAFLRRPSAVRKRYYSSDRRLTGGTDVCR